MELSQLVASNNSKLMTCAGIFFILFKVFINNNTVKEKMKTCIFLNNNLNGPQ